MAHFYTDFVFVPGVAAFDECPKTQTFSRIMFVMSDPEKKALGMLDDNHANQIGVLVLTYIIRVM